ncbi:hypothetical protein [Geomonas silvestris]|uniref:hypothetical protein n=1 Tax=Geomonas silvestris TaxID=2740184 RepID=UPI003530DB53
MPRGTRFEKLQKPDTAELPSCPVCGASDVEKVRSPFAATAHSGSARCTPIG